MGRPGLYLIVSISIHITAVVAAALPFPCSLHASPEAGRILLTTDGTGADCACAALWAAAPITCIARGQHYPASSGNAWRANVHLGFPRGGCCESVQRRGWCRRRAMCIPPRRRAARRPAGRQGRSHQRAGLDDGRSMAARQSTDRFVHWAQPHDRSKISLVS